MSFLTSHNWKIVQLELHLRWQMNINSYMIYRTAPFSTTLYDP